MNSEIVPNQAALIEAYNDYRNYPSLSDVADALGLAKKTVKNRVAILRGVAKETKTADPLISRVAIKRLLASSTSNNINIRVEENEDAPEVKASPQEHAANRAEHLEATLRFLVQSSRYPIINPQAILVGPSVKRTYDKNSRDYRGIDAAPRTYISDTLRTAPVEDQRNRKFLFTGAQNDAPLHEGFWENLKAYAHHINAEIVVGVWTYETQWWSENNPVSRAYAPELEEHLCFGQMEIGPDFVFCGDVNIMPTAKSPLQGLRTHSRGRWGVFPHSRLQLSSIPSTNPTKQAVQIMTTGACTRPKVIPRLAGNKAIFHHVIGATLVEFDEDGDVFCRQLNATEDGSFYDLTNAVTCGDVIEDIHVRSVVGADLHMAKLGNKACKATFGFDVAGATRVPGSVLDVLDPDLYFVHDGHDQEIGNHHRADDGHFNFMLAKRGRTSIENEIRRFGQFLLNLRRTDTDLKIVVVESNHDIALTRYIREGRHRNDGVNALFGARLEVALLEYQERVAWALDRELPTPKFSLLEHAIRSLFGMSSTAHVEWAYDGYSYMIDGIECGHHGFRGANGAFGTAQGFSEMGGKMTIGDKHSPQILDGVYVAGAMELQQGYNKGPSSWAVTHVVQYQNGKRALLTLQNGKWRA